jgi:two-component system response regulator HydG
MAEQGRRVLVVDDELAMAETLADGLVERGYEAIAVGSSQEAATRLAEQPWDALVTDLRMPGVDGLSLLALSKRAAPERPVIIMTAYSAVESAIESIRQGAYHYLTKPFKVEELALFLARALDESRLRAETTALKRALRDRFSLSKIIGRSPAMQQVCDLVERVADATAPVLVTGETGTGKGLVARALHGESARASAPFVTVNCAALPETLLESELFGHVKGAFTGATAARAGLLAEASGGTLFLDEIGEMSPALQAKLLDVIERGVVRPVGSDREVPISVRLVAATHRDLRARVASGHFREDLLYRLEVVTIELPALRHRREDLPLLVEHAIAQAKSRHPRSPMERLSPAAMDRLLSHDWPGNVRELEHVIERLVLLARDAVADVGSLPPTVVKGAPETSRQSFPTEVVPLREMSRRYAAWALEQLGGRKGLTAEKLEIDTKTLSRLLGPSEEDKS